MEPRQIITIVAFGDSITVANHQKLDDRWPEIVRCKLEHSFIEIDIKLFNAGVGGNTSREGLVRIEQDVLSHHPHYVLFEFGNDATPEPDRHVSLEKFRENVNLIITKVAKKTGGNAIPMTFPPVIDKWHTHYEHPFYKLNGGQDTYQESYRAVTRQVAHERSVPLIDIDCVLRKCISERGPESCILPDGVHLTLYGNECVAGAVLEVLSPEIEKNWIEKEADNRMQL